MKPMRTFYRSEPGPADLRKEMVRAGFDVASIERDSESIGCTLDEYMEAFVTRPHGLCDRINRDAMSAAEIADTMRLSREMDNMKKFFDQFDRQEPR